MSLLVALSGSDEIPDELLPYKERLSPRFFEIRRKVARFLVREVLPRNSQFAKEKKELSNQWAEPPVLNLLREKARAAGLWNLFLPEVSGLSVLEYASIAELLGISSLANQALNCSAPDTGNMEVLEKFGSPEQKEKWLEPLLQGKIRSCFAMTEPGVASSDATNICTRIDRDGDEYVVTGHKWYISGAMRPECKLAIVLGRSPVRGGSKHQQQTMILVPMDAKGVRIVRAMAVFGHEHDHAEIVFDHVRVPASNVVLGEGRGFEIAQGRLGPGRIHHCMRTIGVADMALAALVHRAKNRVAFGTLLSEKDSVRLAVAEGRMELTQCRQLCYLAAVMMDEKGAKEARKYIAMIKVAAPRAALNIIDEAIQVHGAHGVSQDSRLYEMYHGIRTIRLADGPDVVHLNTVAKAEFRGASSPFAAIVSGTNPNLSKFAALRSPTVETRSRL